MNSTFYADGFRDGQRERKPSPPTHRQTTCLEREYMAGFHAGICSIPRLTSERARKLKGSLEMPRATEEQAERVAGNLNRRLPYNWTSIGRQYRVLSNYPSGTLRLALIGA